MQSLWLRNGNAQYRGIVGRNEESGQIIDCINYADVIGEYQTGGVAGINRGTIKGCENNGNINNTDRNVSDASSIRFNGGIVGNNLGTTTDCINRGNIGF